MSTKPASNEATVRFDAADFAALSLAAVTGIVGLSRVVLLPGASGLDDTTLKFFGAAGVLLVVRKIKSLSFGDWKAEFEEAKRQAEEAMEEAKTAASMVRLGTETTAEIAPTRTSPSGRDNSLPTADPRAQAWTMKPGTVEDDPWKDVFGGKAENNHRRLSATVVPSKGDPDWFRVRLSVESTDPINFPLTGRVRFFLHDTFANDKPVVKVINGRAGLRLGAYGAFTVGMLADDGATRLELDLADDDSFPPRFRAN